MFRLMLPFGVVIATALLPVVMPDTLPPTPPGRCRCGITGDGMVVFYDEGGSAVITESKTFALSYITESDSNYPCGFTSMASTKLADNGTQLLVIEALRLTLYQDVYSRTFVTKDGIWNSVVPGGWISNPENFTGTSIKTSADGQGGYVIESVEQDCDLRFDVRIDGVRSKILVYVDKADYGGRIDGICGNCNDVVDEYDSLPNDTSIYGPLVLVDSYVMSSLMLPPPPTN